MFVGDIILPIKNSNNDILKENDENFNELVQAIVVRVFLRMMNKCLFPHTHIAHYDRTKKWFHPNIAYEPMSPWGYLKEHESLRDSCMQLVGTRESCFSEASCSTCRQLCWSLLFPSNCPLLTKLQEGSPVSWYFLSFPPSIEEKFWFWENSSRTAP